MSDGSSPFQVGQCVRFSPTGRSKVQSMPEAWGLHRALYGQEVGEVLDYQPAEGEFPASVSVDFASGSAHHWDPENFEAASDLELE